MNFGQSKEKNALSSSDFYVKTITWFSVIIVLSFLAFRPFTLNSGLSTAEAVGPYLNGVFPTSLLTSIRLQERFPNALFSSVLAIVPEPKSNRLHIAERGGRMLWISKDGIGADQTIFMDISDRVWTGQDSGLLGFAFHPDYNADGSPNQLYFYVYYVTQHDNKEYIRLSRFSRNPVGNTADPTSELILIEQELGPTLHRGGGILFREDGFLYLSIGDLGWKEEAQNLSNRLSGGVIRIDVDQQGGAISHPIRRSLQSQGQGVSQHYFIPNSNPFMSPDSSTFEEYFAIGCRNPHRMTLDLESDEIYIGNVGSNQGEIREEINLLQKGANYGWPFREGKIDRPEFMAIPDSIIGTLKDPVFEYAHNSGNKWIIGGYIYRGSQIPQLDGEYVFADGASKKIWSIDLQAADPAETLEEITNSLEDFYTLGQDQDGELYIGSNSLQLISQGSTDNGIVANGSFFIRAVHSQKYLGVSGLSVQNGANIQQNSFSNINHQFWTLSYLGEEQYKITNVLSQKAMEVAAFGNAEGSNVQQWEYTSGTNQKWIIRQDSGSYFRIIGLHSGLALEVTDSLESNGANVQVSEIDPNSEHQLWEFVYREGKSYLPPPNAAPSLLSATGIFEDLENLKPNEALIPYDVISPLWSDGAIKDRWMAIPNDGIFDQAHEKINWSEDSEWSFPEGTVFIKHFEMQVDENNPDSTRRLETRVMVHGEDGYYGLTYYWFPDHSDAILLVDAYEEKIEIAQADGGTRNLSWYFPSRSDCFSCHTPASSIVLGLKTRHLNKDILYPQSGLKANQLETFQHLQMFDSTFDAVEVSEYFSSSAFEDSTASLEEKVRSYLDMNCSNCHRPDGGTRASWNALSNEDLSNANIINGVLVDELGITGAKVVVPGDTAASILYQRIKARNNSIAMPPLASSLPDTAAINQIAQWILGLDPPTLYLNVLLEGPYDAASGSMRTDLVKVEFFQQKDPYLQEVMVLEDSLFAAIDSNIVDWVLVELRDAKDSSNVLHTKPCLLLSDGTLVDEHRNPELSFKGAARTAYFISIRHYNHLGIMTASPIDLRNSPEIDFSNPNFSLFRNEIARAQNRGIKLMWAGDANGDGTINAIDKNFYWRSENGQTYIYSQTKADFNLDGVVNALDKNALWRVNNSRIAALP